MPFRFGPPQGFRATSVVDNGTPLAGGTADGVMFVNSSGNIDSGSVLSFNGTNLSMASGQILLPTQIGTTPNIAHASNTDTGLFFPSTTSLRVAIDGSTVTTWASGQFLINGIIDLGASSDLYLTREGAAIFQLGQDVNGAATAQTFKAHDGITGTDIAGASMTLASARGTGAGASGSVILSTSTTLGTGTTAQTLVARLTLSRGAVTTDNATLTFADKLDIALNTGTGTKIGTATTQKLGFYNATPIVQGASVADASGGSVIDVEARVALNALISRIEATGLIATV